jgi:poly(A) polymerase
MSWAAGPQSLDNRQWKRLLEINLTWQPPVCPISGQDILARGVAPGPQVGEILREFEAWWIANDFPNERSLLDNQLDKLLQRN